MDEVRLHYCHGTSDKVYRIALEKSAGDLGAGPVHCYQVTVSWGRRTSPDSQSQVKATAVSHTTAVALMHSIMGEKIGKGYALLPAMPTPRAAPAPPPSPSPSVTKRLVGRGRGEATLDIRLKPSAEIIYPTVGRRLRI